MTGARLPKIYFETGSVRGVSDNSQPELMPEVTPEVLNIQETSASAHIAASPERETARSTRGKNAWTGAEVPQAFYADYVRRARLRSKDHRRSTSNGLIGQYTRSDNRQGRRTARFVSPPLAPRAPIVRGGVTLQPYVHLRSPAEQLAQLKTEAPNHDSVELRAADSTVAAPQAESGPEPAAWGLLFWAAGVLLGTESRLRADPQIPRADGTQSTGWASWIFEIVTSSDPASSRSAHLSLDLALTKGALPPSQKANSVVNTARIRLNVINRIKVSASVSTVVLKPRSGIECARWISVVAARRTRRVLCIPMFDQARIGLVVLENLDDVRATDWIFSSYWAPRLTDDVILLVDRGVVSRIVCVFNLPFRPLIPKRSRTFSDLMATLPHDVNGTRDLPNGVVVIAKRYTERKSARVAA